MLWDSTSIRMTVLSFIFLSSPPVTHVATPSGTHDSVFRESDRSKLAPLPASAEGLHIGESYAASDAEKLGAGDPLVQFLACAFHFSQEWSLI